MTSQRDLSPYGVRGAAALRRQGGALPPLGHPHSNPQKPGPAPLSQRDFFLLCALSMLVMGAFNWYLPRQIEHAKVASAMDRLWILHGVSIIGNLMGFWLVTRLFLSRFRDVLGGEELPGYARGLFRFAILSPLFGVQMLILALFVPSSEGDRRGFSSVMIAFVLSAIVVHGAYITWKVSTGRLAYSGMHNRFVPVPPPLDNESRELFKSIDALAVPKEYKALSDAFDAHIMPYLNPSARVGIGVGRDFLRADALDEYLDSRSGANCKPSPLFLGVKVTNCFFDTYEKLNSIQPFLTNAPALYYENRRRTAKAPIAAIENNVQTVATTGAVTGSATGATAGATGETAPPANPHEQILRPIAQSLLALENMLRLVDPGHIRMSVREATKPILLLPFFGNAEMPFLELARDIQQVLIARSVSRSIQPQLPTLREQLKPTQMMLPREVYQQIEAKLNELEERVNRLHKTPFAIVRH